MSKGPVLEGRFARLLARRHGGVVLFILGFAAISLAIRVMLLAKAAREVTWDASLLAAFGWGFVFDLAAAAWFSLPVTLVLTILPARMLQRHWMRWLIGAGTAAIAGFLIFGAVAEWLFWDEFGVRFNFIAVDYLVYTHEVIGNIRESYPMPWIFAGIGTGAILLTWLGWRTGLPARWLAGPAEPWRRRWLAGIAWAAGAVALGMLVDSSWLPAFQNNYNRELGKNGPWAFVAAFRENQLDFDEFYPTMPVPDAFARLRDELTEDGSVLLRPNSLDSLRWVKNDGPELRPNIIQITVESLSGEFLGIFGNTDGLTPNLDALAAKSLVFDNFYATGTRTDRGMEALTLSLPPTPGRSIVKRPKNENLFTLGSVLREKGYDTAFIYGGFGYFDNMNYFFGHNGYRVIDRASVDRSDITFANVWGACDEDLFRWVERDADAAYASGKPFHSFVMTTSNHRPYTFPAGRIDLPSKISGRRGAVKYTDYAIGKFIRDCEGKPWFNNTVFVIVADHCASSAGKTEVPVQNYHIPLIIYAPGGQIAPGRVDTLMSQMDYAPTLLGLLHWSYPSRFFGHDVRKVEPDEAHALVGTYQKLGYLEKEKICILQPIRERDTYRYDPTTFSLTHQPPDAYSESETISVYQSASYLFGHALYNALSPDEIRRYTTLGQSVQKKARLHVASR